MGIWQSISIVAEAIAPKVCVLGISLYSLDVRSTARP
jgi:hypothetical protein